MYSTVKAPASFDASLAAAGGPGTVRSGFVGPVLCYSSSYIVVVGVTANSVSERIAMPSVRSSEVSGHSSVEQLISAL